MTYNALNIIKGGISSFRNINEGLKEDRIKNACSKCYAYHNENNQPTGWCSSKRNGCGCKMDWKARLEDQKCVAGIWANDTVNLDKLEEFNKQNNFKIKQSAST